jgi:hypothetical protein
VSDLADCSAKLLKELDEIANTRIGGDECDYCLKSQYHHGGKCSGRHNSAPCLLFERDPRGKIMYLENARVSIPFGEQIPELHKDNDQFTLYDIKKTIQILRVNKIEWNKDARGLHGIFIYIDISYWSDENGVAIKKPKLRLIKA